MTQTQATQEKSDTWSTWLLGRRHGNDSAYQQRMLNVVENYRERMLDRAASAGDDASRCWYRGWVNCVWSDRARWLIAASNFHGYLPAARGSCRATGDSARLREQCTFVQGSADKLVGIRDATVDVVATRAVLTYVQDKAQAFREFYRVLKPGGRISLAEPIFQDDAVDACQLTNLVEKQPNHPEIGFLRLVQRYRPASSRRRPPPLCKARSPITTSDLYRFARDAGFVNIHLELHIDLRPALPITWEAYLDVANHPWAPTLREVLARSFSREESELFEKTLRPIVEAGQSEQKQLVAYLIAEKKK